MSDPLERWLSDVEGRHVGYDHEIWMGKECAYCDGPWPCDAAQAARVIRAQARFIRHIERDTWESGDLLIEANEVQQRIAAIIEGNE